MSVFLFENKELSKAFLPLTFTRSIADLRLGVFTFLERWHWFTNECAEVYHAQSYSSDDLFVSAHAVVDKVFVEHAVNLPTNTSLWYDGFLLARKGGLQCAVDEKRVEVKVLYLDSLWDLVAKSAEVLMEDISLIRKRKYSTEFSDKHTVVYGNKNVFVEEGVQTRACVINAEQGAVYLGKGVKLLEGSVVYGPAFIGENTIICPGAKLLGGTYIGENCVVGGEVKRTYIQGYSNKAHEGYLGDSIVGAWCNFGAGTNVSNLKNNFGEIKLYSFTENKISPSGRTKAGVLMGDYAKTAIGSRINSGTVIGVGTVLFNAELTGKFYPNFSWGEKKLHDVDPFFKTARVMWDLQQYEPAEVLVERLKTLWQERKNES